MNLEGVRTLKDVDVANKRVLVRTDYNVPLKADGSVGDDARVKASLPTIQALLSFEAKQVILCSHLGRPKGKKVAALSLKPVAELLSSLLGEDVSFAASIDKVSKTKRVVLLENVRFNPGEEANDTAFAKKLASLCTVFVNDAFGTAHRDHASTTGVAKLVKESCVGLLMQKELEHLDFSTPERPFLAIIGASKISDKIVMLESLLKKADQLVLGGGIVFTFLKARGLEVGTSLCEDEALDTARKLLGKYAEKILLPDDIVVSEELEGTPIFTVDADRIPPGQKGLDVGDVSVEQLLLLVDKAKTVFWNGPLGVFEVSPFDHATDKLAHHLAKSKATVVVGGGDTASFVHEHGLTRYFAHVSTGGGAALKLVAGESLVAVEALRAKK